MIAKSIDLAAQIFSRKRLLGHPIGLIFLLIIALCHFFAYFGIIGLLKPYLIGHILPMMHTLMSGQPEERSLMSSIARFGWGYIHPWLPADIQAQASTFISWLMSLILISFVILGYLSDKFIGQKKSLSISIVMLIAGYFLMCCDGLFLFAIVLFTLGNALLSPNVAVKIGSLYQHSDARMDSGYVFFYMVINLGALLGFIVFALISPVLGYKFCFLFAGFLLVIALGTYSFFASCLGDAANEKLPKKNIKPIANHAKDRDPLLSGEWKRIWVLAILSVLNIIYWTFYHYESQALEKFFTAWGHGAGIAISPFQLTLFKLVNPALVLLLSPCINLLWYYQAKRGSSADSVTKMTIGSIIIGLLFITMIFFNEALGHGSAAVFGLFMGSCLLSIGEIYFAPMAFALVAKISPIRLVSTMMGLRCMTAPFGGILSEYIELLYNAVSKNSFLLIITILVISAWILMYAFTKLSLGVIAELDQNKDKIKILEKESVIAKMTQMLAHDVRRPFSLLNIMIENLEMSHSIEEVKEVLKYMTPEVKKAITSVDGMLRDVMEAGANTSPRWESAALASVLDCSLGEICTIYDQSDIKIKVDLAHRNPLYVESRKIVRVFSNIIANAFQAINFKGDIWIKSYDAENAMATICIGNFGSFIPREDIPHLFEAYFTKNKTGGTGLGLAIAQKIVLSHGGNIWCESSEERRTVEFYISLPLDMTRVTPTKLDLTITTQEINEARRNGCRLF